MTSIYKPNPVDTENVIIPDEIQPLVELMAWNVHEVWAQKRMAEGWTYGPIRDDKAKHHPCIVPYDELPEVEKEYDRATACETLKLIMSLGFKISKSDDNDR